MKMWITALAAGTVFVCTLSACGGGGSSTAPASTAPHPPSPPAVKLPIVIDWRGDSTNWGVCTDVPPTYRCSPTPAQLLQADMDAALGAGVVQVVDHSAPGSTFQQDLAGTGEYAATAYGTGKPLATVLASDDAAANIVVTNEEINDQEVEHDTPDQYQSDAQQWIQTVQASGKIAVLLEPNPIAPASLQSNFVDATPYVNAVHAAAAQYDAAVAPLYQAFIHVPNWNLVYLGSDGVHPNAAGYAYKEQQYFPTILSAARNLLGK